MNQITRNRFKSLGIGYIQQVIRTLEFMLPAYIDDVDEDGFDRCALCDNFKCITRATVGTSTAIRLLGDEICPWMLFMPRNARPNGGNPNAQCVKYFTDVLADMIPHNLRDFVDYEDVRSLRYTGLEDARNERARGIQTWISELNQLLGELNGRD